MSKKQRLVHAPERKINDSNWPQAQIRTRRVQYSNDFFFSYFPMLYMPVEKKSGRSWTRTRIWVSVFISSPSLSDTAVLFTAQPVALFVRLDNGARNYENVILVQLRLSEISSNFSLMVSKKINRPTFDRRKRNGTTRNVSMRYKRIETRSFCSSWYFLIWSESLVQGGCIVVFIWRAWKLSQPTRLAVFLTLGLIVSLVVRR